MNANIPVLALSAIGVLMVAAGLLVTGMNIHVLGGILIVLFAFILQEMAKRRS